MAEPLHYADAYDTELVGRLRSSLLHAATVLGDVLDHIVVVGGLVPSLLARPEHAMPRPPTPGRLLLGRGQIASIPIRRTQRCSHVRFAARASARVRIHAGATHDEQLALPGDGHVVLRIDPGPALCWREHLSAVDETSRSVVNSPIFTCRSFTTSSCSHLPSVGDATTTRRCPGNVQQAMSA